MKALYLAASFIISAGVQFIFARKFDFIGYGFLCTAVGLITGYFLTRPLDSERPETPHKH